MKNVAIFGEPYETGRVTLRDLVDALTVALAVHPDAHVDRDHQYSIHVHVPAIIGQRQPTKAEQAALLAKGLRWHPALQCYFPEAMEHGRHLPRPPFDFYAARAAPPAPADAGKPGEGCEGAYYGNGEGYDVRGCERSEGHEGEHGPRGVACSAGKAGCRIAVRHEHLSSAEASRRLAADQPAKEDE